MVFKLTKKQIAERDGLATDLRAKAARLAIAIVDYNDTLATVAPALRNAVDAYNESIEAAREFVTEIAEPAREEFDNKSERWRASDKGVKANRWVEAWEGINLDDLEIEVPESLDDFDPSELSGEMEDLPDGSAE